MEHVKGKRCHGLSIVFPFLCICSVSLLSRPVGALSVIEFSWDSEEYGGACMGKGAAWTYAAMRPPFSDIQLNEIPHSRTNCKFWETLGV